MDLLIYLLGIVQVLLRLLILSHRDFSSQKTGVYTGMIAQSWSLSFVTWGGENARYLFSLFSTAGDVPAGSFVVPDPPCRPSLHDSRCHQIALGLWKHHASLRLASPGGFMLFEISRHLFFSCGFCCCCCVVFCFFCSSDTFVIRTSYKLFPIVPLLTWCKLCFFFSDGTLADRGTSCYLLEPD